MTADPIREPAAEPPSAARHERYREAASLLRLWMDSEAGPDDEVWPLVEEELGGIRMRCGVAACRWHEVSLS
jgi:hypothetical protein